MPPEQFEDQLRRAEAAPFGFGMLCLPPPPTANQKKRPVTVMETRGEHSQVCSGMCPNSLSVKQRRRKLRKYLESREARKSTWAVPIITRDDPSSSYSRTTTIAATTAVAHDDNRITAAFRTAPSSTTPASLLPTSTVTDPQFDGSSPRISPSSLPPGTSIASKSPGRYVPTALPMTEGNHATRRITIPPLNTDHGHHSNVPGVGGIIKRQCGQRYLPRVSQNFEHFVTVIIDADHQDDCHHNPKEGTVIRKQYYHNHDVLSGQLYRNHPGNIRFNRWCQDAAQKISTTKTTR